MPSVVLCKCGVRFRTKGSAAGSRRKCPICGRELVVPDAPASASLLGRMGRRGILLGSLGLVVLLGGAAGLAAYSGAFRTPEVEVKPAITAAPVAKAPEPDRVKYVAPPASSNLAKSDVMWSLDPVGDRPRSESPLIVPR